MLSSDYYTLKQIIISLREKYKEIEEKEKKLEKYFDKNNNDGKFIYHITADEKEKIYSMRISFLKEQSLILNLLNKLTDNRKSYEIHKLLNGDSHRVILENTNAFKVNNQNDFFAGVDKILHEDFVKMPEINLSKEINKEKASSNEVFIDIAFDHLNVKVYENKFGTLELTHALNYDPEKDIISYDLYCNGANQNFINEILETKFDISALDENVKKIFINCTKLDYQFQSINPKDCSAYVADFKLIEKDKKIILQKK